MNIEHKPVLLNQFLFFFNEYYNKLSNKNIFIDFTFGFGGHSIPLLNLYPNLKIIGFELDTKTCDIIKEKYKNLIENQKLKLINDNFINFKKYLTNDEMLNVIGGIADFGLSSFQISSLGRGFSFNDNLSLDMRINTSNNSITAYEVVNKFTAQKLCKIFKEYGDEPLAYQIANEIIKVRSKNEIKSCYDLAQVIRNVYKRFPKIKSDIDFATKSIMALRIFVNFELDNIKNLLKSCLESFAKDSLLFTISFHSKEDKIVKDFIKTESKDCICPKEIILCKCNHKAKIKSLTKKPICANENEINENPRSRSAKMRIIQFL